jgi:hypothetical protein
MFFLKKIVIKKELLSFILLLTAFTSNAQKVRNIVIDTEKLEKKTLYLSEIAEKVTTITLETPLNSGVMDIFVTNEYLFVTTMSSIHQFTPSGKHIRKFDCGGTVYHSTCDSVRKELYVIGKWGIKSFSFSGELKRTFKIKYPHPINCKFHDGILWIQSADLQDTPNERITKYFLSRLDLSTGKEDFLPLNIQEKFPPTEVRAILRANFIHHNNSLLMSFNADSVLYQIKGKSISPVVKWQFVTYPQFKYNKLLNDKGIVGNYLFVKYKKDDEFLMYLENLKSKEKYIVKSFIDDVFDKGERVSPYIKFFNEEECMFFMGYEREINKDKDVIVIVKFK